VADNDEPSRPGPPVTHRGDYPGVAEWLEGVGSAHWWVRLLDAERDPAATPPTMEDRILGPLEILVQAVRSSSPKRLGEFVSRFRDPEYSTTYRYETQISNDFGDPVVIS